MTSTKTISFDDGIKEITIPTDPLPTFVVVEGIKYQILKIVQRDPHPIVTSNICSICKIEKPIADFYKRSTSPCGHELRKCKKCTCKIQRKKYLLKKNGKIRKYVKKNKDIN